MKTLKNLFVLALSIVALNTVSAQSLKEPVAFKLNNGVNVIVSENENSDKTFSKITLDESAFRNTKDAVKEVFFIMQNQKNDKVKFAENGASVSADVIDFEQALLNAANTMKNADLSQASFDKAKSEIINTLSTYDYDSSVNLASVKALTLTDVKDFYAQLVPAKIYVTIAGNVKTASAKKIASKAFVSWN